MLPLSFTGSPSSVPRGRIQGQTQEAVFVSKVNALLDYVAYVGSFCHDLSFCPILKGKIKRKTRVSRNHVTQTELIFSQDWFRFWSREHSFPASYQVQVARAGMMVRIDSISFLFHTAADLLPLLWRPTLDGGGAAALLFDFPVRLRGLCCVAHVVTRHFLRCGRKLGHKMVRSPDPNLFPGRGVRAERACVFLPLTHFFFFLLIDIFCKCTV